jgi:hypothetical protein
VWTLLCCAYPIVFCLQRGNLEIILAIGMATGMWAYWRGHHIAAALIWGVFGSAKIYPLALLGLFLAGRRYRYIAAGLVTAVLTTLASLAYMGPTIPLALAGTRSGLHAFFGLYALRYDWVSIGYDHSLFSLIKRCLHPGEHQLVLLLRFYTPLMAGMVPALYFLRVRRLSMPNQLLFLTVVSILVPPTSGDYTLLQLYVPLVVLMLFALDGRMAAVAPVFVVLALVLTPLNLLFHAGASLQGQIRSVLLCVLLWLTVRGDFVRENWKSAEVSAPISGLADQLA